MKLSIKPQVVKSRSRSTRLGVIYLATVYHPKTGKMVNGYVGQTRQKPKTRWRQHERGFLDSTGRWNPPQPWSDTIIEWIVVWEGKISDDDLDKKEKYYIHKLKPIYNHSHNLRNSSRITMSEAARLRARREMGIYPRGFKRRALGVPGLLNRWLGFGVVEARIWRKDENAPWQRSWDMVEETAVEEVRAS